MPFPSALLMITWAVFTSPSIHHIIRANMAVGCMFYVLLLVTQLLAFTREYTANKDVRRKTTINIQATTKLRIHCVILIAMEVD